MSVKKQGGEQSHAKKPPDPVVVHEPSQAEMTPLAPVTDVMGLFDDGLPGHRNTRPLRQAAVLQMQRRFGNAYVQRLLEGQSATNDERPTTNDKPRLAPHTFNAKSKTPNRAVHVQREDDDIPELSEEEKAAALAAAAAAEAVATGASNEGKSQVAQSEAKKSVEQASGQQAQQKAGQAMAEAKGKEGQAGEKLAGKGEGEGKKGGGAGPAASRNGASAKVAGAKVAGAKVAGAKVAGAKAAGEKAPASPEEDPAFQAVVGEVRGAGEQQKSHEPAEQKAAEAQVAAEMPGAETEAHAQNQQVGEMAQTETPGFDAAAFKAQLMQRIAALAPQSPSEADQLKESNKLGGLKDEMKGKAGQEADKTQAPLEEKAAAAPDTGSVEPKPVTPLEGPDPGEPATIPSAASATPKPKGTAEVEKPLRQETKEVDQEMADADITDEQLAKSNEPEFQTALESKKEAKTHAQEGPQAYRGEEQQQIEQAQGEATAVSQAGVQGMHGERGQLLNQVSGQQQETKSEDEKARAKVGADIQQIYQKTKTNVEKILGDVDAEVEKVFDAGATAAKQAFENYVDAKMDAYKQRRYGGWLGWARWAKDKIAGMPSEVNAFYQEGRQLYLNKMDAVIDNVVAIIGRAVSEAKAEIARGKQEIQDYVAQLPQNLQEVGQQAAQDINSKFDELEQSVDNKQNELIDSLAQKYNENLQAIDARIDELKAANRGLVDKALDAVAGVIKTILKLKEMLLSVLAQAADAIGKIIKDPIGFLGNLISGVKQGFQNFVNNIGTHIKKGLISWLFGALAGAGIQLPQSFDLKGILTLVMQILGLTWDNLRARAVKMFGEKVVGALEKAFDIFVIIKEQGLGGLWQFIKDKLTNLKDMVMDGIKDMVITQVIKAGVQWLMGILGGPAGAFIKAAKAIYDIVMWFVSNGSRVISLVQSILGSVSAIASGAIGQAASYIEQSLAGAIPIVIGFLASLLGLGDFSGKIRGIIQKVQEPINKAIDWVLSKAKALAKKIGSFFGIGKQEEKEGNSQAKAKARQKLAERTKQPFKDQQELATTVKSIETELTPEGLKSLNIKPKENQAGKFDIIAREESSDVGDAEVTSGGAAPFAVGQQIQYRKRGGRGMAWNQATVDSIDDGKVSLTIKSGDGRGNVGTVSTEKDIPLANFIQGETWQSADGSADDLTKMKEAVAEAGGIVAFMKLMARGGTAKGIDRGAFNDKYRIAEVRGWLADAFRGADKGKHEWIPGEVINEIVARAAAPDQFFEGLKWIDLQHKLRVDTSWVIFKPSRWTPTPYRPLISDTGARSEEREFIIPDGHPGALTLMGLSRPLTTGEGEFHNALKRAFTGSSTIEGYFDSLLSVIEAWVWAGEGASLPIFPRVFYKGQHVESIAQLAAAHERNYIDMRLDLMRVKREVLG
jgi:hypothetical protein